MASAPTRAGQLYHRALLWIILANLTENRLVTIGFVIVAAFWFVEAARQVYRSGEPL